MIPARIAIHCALAALLLTAAGCASAPSKFYDLTSTATASGQAPVSASVMVGPVTIPAAVDQPQMVVQVADNQVVVDEFNRWDAPLSDSIARVVADDLAVQLGSPEVATVALANFNPAYRVTIEVQRFESLQGQAAVLDAVWTVRKTSTGEARSGRTSTRQTVSGQNFDQLAAAHSRALATLSSDVATAIRAEEEAGSAKQTE